MLPADRDSPFQSKHKLGPMLFPNNSFDLVKDGQIAHIKAFSFYNIMMLERSIKLYLDPTGAKKHA